MDANQIIDALGGTFAVARLCNVKPPSVSEWRRSGIPAARLQFLQLARPDAFSPPPPAEQGGEVADAA
jgi:DNA-binding transcriptional regulator YdaS (Cro superfamily)